MKLLGQIVLFSSVGLGWLMSFGIITPKNDFASIMMVVVTGGIGIVLWGNSN